MPRIRHSLQGIYISLKYGIYYNRAFIIIDLLCHSISSMFPMKRLKFARKGVSEGATRILNALNIVINMHFELGRFKLFFTEWLAE